MNTKERRRFTSAETGETRFFSLKPLEDGERRFYEALNKSQD